MNIRMCTPNDYASAVAIRNTLYPNRPTTVQAWLEGDQQRKPEYKRQVWVALEGERIVGYGGYDQDAFDYDPQKFYVFVNVLPDEQRQGIGAALYDQVMADLARFNPNKSRADCYEDLPQGIRFAEQRGFKEVFRETPLILDVITFDPTPYAGLEDRLRAHDIEIKTVRDLEGDPDRNRKLYDLYWLAFADVPQEGVVTPIPFEEWVNWSLLYPGASPDNYFVAVCGEDYVGLSEFARKPDTDIVQGGLVGVRREFRGRGIALALQVRAILYAHKIGCASIETSTSITNVPMRSLYERLGFVRQPDWLQMEKNCPPAE